MTHDFAQKLITSISSPNLHVPQYNFKTRSEVYKIYETISVLREDLLDKIEPTLFMSCILSSIDGESDPRNLMVVFEMMHFMLLNFCQKDQQEP